MDIESNSCSG